MFTVVTVPIFNTVLLIVISLVVGLGYLRWAKAQGATTTIKLLNEQIAAQDRKIASQDSDIKVLSATVLEQTKHLDMLTSLVKGVPAWERLHAGIDRLEVTAKRIDELMEAYPTDWLRQLTVHMRQTTDLYEYMRAEEVAAHDARQAR